VFQVLVGEISEPRMRGILTGTNFLSHSVGILLVYILGAFMEWRVVSGISAVLPMLSLVAFALLPESPVWLIRHNRIQEAEKALRWLRGGAEQVRIGQCKCWLLFPDQSLLYLDISLRNKTSCEH
jgi:MFS family permease